MSRPLHILIIDDDLDDTEFLVGAFLSRLPETCFTAVQDGQAALDFLLRNARPDDCPDVAFLDLHMPGMHGHQVLLALRATEQCRAFPVMVLSTSTLETEAEKCRQAGCTDYFTKPTRLEDYEAIVNATLRHLDSRTR